jgi:hypothetical protein
MPPADPLSLIRDLDPDAIRARLDQMGREREALLTLLRAALRLRRRGGREEGKERTTPPPTQEVSHAAS